MSSALSKPEMVVAPHSSSSKQYPTAARVSPKLQNDISATMSNNPEQRGRIRDLLAATFFFVAQIVI
jgi:hypothetical protein